MSNGIDDGLSYRLRRKLICDRSLRTMGPGFDGAVNLREHKIDCLVNHFEDSAVEDLVRRNGFADFRAVEVQALDK